MSSYEQLLVKVAVIVLCLVGIYIYIRLWFFFQGIIYNFLANRLKKNNSTLLRWLATWSSFDLAAAIANFICSLPVLIGVFVYAVFVRQGYRIPFQVGKANTEVVSETCVSPGENKMAFKEAMKLALSGECAKMGMLAEKGNCNAYTGTWWIDLDLFEKKEGCNPACVINVDTKATEINWRCTGLNPGLKN